MVPMQPYILVVDDLADMAESTAELLTLWGYDAIACTSGAEALACALVRRPATVLLDLVMPRMDGFVLALELRRLRGCESVPLVALSGYATPECVLRACRSGIAHFLLKPAAPEVLRRLLCSLLGGNASAPIHRVWRGAPFARLLGSRRTRSRVTVRAAEARLDAFRMFVEALT